MSIWAVVYSVCGLLGAFLGVLYVLIGWKCNEKESNVKDDPRVRNALWILLMPVGIFALQGVGESLSGTGFSPITAMVSYLAGGLVGGAICILILSYALIKSAKAEIQVFPGEKINEWQIILEYLHKGYDCAQEKINSYNRSSRVEIRKNVRTQIKNYTTSLSACTYLVLSFIKNKNENYDKDHFRSLSKNILDHIANHANEYCRISSFMTPVLNANYMIAVKIGTGEAEEAKDRLTFLSLQSTIDLYSHFLLLQEYAYPDGAETFSVLASDTQSDGPPVLPGAPIAFCRREPKLVNTSRPEFDTKTPDDLRKAVKDYFTQKRFKSFISLPIFSGDRDGECLGVVNIESSSEDFAKFDEEQLSALYALLTPFAALLGALLDRAPVSSYSMNRDGV